MDPATDSTPIEIPGADPSATPLPVSPESVTPVEPEAGGPDPARQELESLRRIIAMDPNLSAQYSAQKYGVSFLPSPQGEQASRPQSPKSEVPKEPDFQELFGEEGYNPYNQEHQWLMNKLAAQQVVAPLLEYVDTLRKQDQTLQEQQYHQAMSKAEVELHGLVDKKIPGFKDLYSKLMGNQTLQPKEQMLCDAVESILVRELSKYPVHLRANPVVHQEVVERLTPYFQQLSQTAGAAQKSSNAAHNLEMHVETSSNSVPAQSGSGFAEAHKKGDLLGMMTALRAS